MNEANAMATPRMADIAVVRVQPMDGKEHARMVAFARLRMSTRLIRRLLDENRDHRDTRCGVLGEHEVDALETVLGALPV